MRNGVRNCDLLGEFFRWGRWIYEGRGGEGRGVELVWVKGAGEGEDEVTVGGGCYCYL